MGADSVGSAAYTSYWVLHPSLCCSVFYISMPNSVWFIWSHVKQTDILPFSPCMYLNQFCVLFGVPAIAVMLTVMLTYIGNTQAGLPAMHKLFTLLFLFFLFFTCKAPFHHIIRLTLLSSYYYCVSCWANLGLLGWKLIFCLVFSVSASLFILGIIIFLLFFLILRHSAVTILNQRGTFMRW